MHSPTMQVGISREALARGKEDTVYVSFDVIASGHTAVGGEPGDVLLALDAAVAVQVARDAQVVCAAQELNWTMADGVELHGFYEYRPAIRELPMTEGAVKTISVPPIGMDEKSTIVAAIKLAPGENAEFPDLFTVRAPDGTTNSHGPPAAEFSGKVDATMRGLFQVSRTQILAVDEDTRGEAARRLAGLTDDKELTQLEEVRNRTIVVDDATPNPVHRAKTVGMQ